MIPNVKNHIPNFITLLNLLSGGISIVMAFSGELACAGWFILIAALLDFFDGFVARLLNAKSEIGGQLDSLADVISFGLAPAVIVYHLMLQSANLPVFDISGFNIFPFLSFLLVAGSAYRLAKFNTDPGQETVFKGVPTPAMGLFILALPLVLAYSPESFFVLLIGNFYVLLGFTVILTWLMVSSLPMFSLKFKSYGWKGNEPRYFLAICLVILLFVFQFMAIPLLIILYILISLIYRPS